MMLRALMIAAVARLALAQTPEPPAEAEEQDTTAAERADALRQLVRRIGARAYAEVVLHLFDPDAKVRARAASLLPLVGDPGGRARPRIEAMAAGEELDADVARAALAALYPSSEAPPAPHGAATGVAPRHAALEPALPGDAALLAAGPDRESIIPPFDAATTAGTGRASMDLQLGSETAEVALRIGFHARADAGVRMLFEPEEVWGPQVRLWHPVTRRFHVLASLTPWVFGLSEDYEYDEASRNYRRRNKSGLGAAGLAATYGSNSARLVVSAEQRGPTDDPHAVLGGGLEFSLIRRMLNFRIGVEKLWTRDRRSPGFLVALDSVF